MRFEEIKNVIVRHRSGSHAYGMSTPESDLDIRGVFCAGKIEVRSGLFNVKEVEVGGQDEKYFELVHFCRLAADCNPNILETLWVEPEDVLVSTPAYEMLRENRGLFLSSKIAHTATGYAMSQLQRIMGHKKWIMNPQSEEPPGPEGFFRLVYNFTEEKIFAADFKIMDYNQEHFFIRYGSDVFGIYEGDFGPLFAGGAIKDNHESLDFAEYEKDKKRPPRFIVKFHENNYKEALVKHKQYWEWKKNRNPVRAELENRMGYDGKHAAHLVRLMRMGMEALSEGVIRVRRPDAEELLAIRNGKLTYDELIEYAKEMDGLVRGKLYAETGLPRSADKRKIAELILAIQDLVWPSVGEGPVRCV